MKSLLKFLLIIFCLTLQTTAHGAHRVIIDTDMGGDDAAAIILAAKSPAIQIEGVTVVAGNVSLEQAAKNALMTLEVAGTSAQVYKGAEKSFAGVETETFSVYGEDGMGDADLIHPKTLANDKPAVDFILETVRENPDEIEIILLGPATNIALAIDKDPATMSRVKKFWSMGTSGFGQGNATPVAEFNVYKDAEAYKILLDSGVPVTIVGWDIANDEKLCFNRKILDKMKNSSPAQKFIATANEKYLKYCQDVEKIKNGPVSDAVLIAAVAWEDFVQETEMCHASCMTDKNETYGQVIFYRKNYAYDTMPTFDNYNVEVITKVKSADFISRFNKFLGR